MKWVLDYLLPRLLLSGLVFCFLIATGMVSPAHAQIESSKIASIKLTQEYNL